MTIISNGGRIKKLDGIELLSHVDEGERKRLPNNYNEKEGDGELMRKRGKTKELNISYII